MERKNLYIIAGPNGAGKTTACLNLLPQITDCHDFVNSDEIAKGLSPFHPEEVKLKAAKLMVKRINDLMSKEQSFSLETTLASRSHVSTIREAQDHGYNCHLIFFYLPNPQAAIARVEQRVSEGGHRVSAPVITRRFHTGLKNLFDLFLPICDSWMIYDNSLNPRELIATGRKNGKTEIFNQTTYEQILAYVRA